MLLLLLQVLRVLQMADGSEDEASPEECVGPFLAFRCGLLLWNARVRSPTAFFPLGSGFKGAVAVVPGQPLAPASIGACRCASRMRERHGVPRPFARALPSDARGGNSNAGTYASGTEVGVEDQASGVRPDVFMGSPASSGGGRKGTLSPSSVVPLNQDVDAL